MEEFNESGEVAEAEVAETEETEETDGVDGDAASEEDAPEAEAETDADEATEAEVAETDADEAPVDEANNKDNKNADDKDDDAQEAVNLVDMDKIEAVLNATADTTAMTPQMRRMMSRQEESTKRVEESIKGTKSNPRWFVPLFCILMVIGLIWVVTYYLTSKYPIPNIGAWNLLIGFVIIMIGFLMTMWWR
ncbi:cell division protein CrgA [Bifidobacterium panos]|uniref:cell division protein CrgA n=1 Tax=Bifidobacterium panos TaxID=2675321 RepID=UPI0015551A4F